MSARVGAGIPWLWVVALAALAVGAGLFAFGRDDDGSTDAVGVVRDASGDVVGADVATVAPLLDLREVTLVRKGDDLTVTVELAQALDRTSIGDEAVTYEVQLRANGIDYVVQASLSSDQVAAAATDLAAIDRPFALPRPSVLPKGLRIVVPKRAVPRLPATFAWGVAVRVAGSEDVAPSDRSALFPPPKGQE
jgi:hypothetical protein